MLVPKPKPKDGESLTHPHLQFQELQSQVSLEPLSSPLSQGSEAGSISAHGSPITPPALDRRVRGRKQGSPEVHSSTLHVRKEGFQVDYWHLQIIVLALLVLHRAEVDLTAKWEVLIADKDQDRQSHLLV